MIKNEDTLDLSVLRRQITTKRFPKNANMPSTQLLTWSAKFAIRSSQEENSSASGIHVVTCLAMQQNLKASVFRVVIVVTNSKAFWVTSVSGLSVSVSQFISVNPANVVRSTCWILLLCRFKSRRDINPLRIPGSITLIWLALRSNSKRLSRSLKTNCGTREILLWLRSSFPSQWRWTNESVVMFRWLWDRMTTRRDLLETSVGTGIWARLELEHLTTCPSQLHGSTHSTSEKEIIWIHTIIITSIGECTSRPVEARSRIGLQHPLDVRKRRRMGRTG